MARINNKDLTKEIIDGAKINIIADDIPNQLARSVVPVMEVNPKLLRTATIIRGTVSTASAASFVIYGTPTDKDFYLIGFTQSHVKDDVCDVSTGSSSISCFINGVNQTLSRIALLTLTAQEQTVFMNFQTPIKIDRGTNITMSYPTFTAGTSNRGATIIGYEVDD